MSNYRAQVILKTVDAIPANFITNSICLQTADSDPLDTGDCTTAIKDFYDDLRPLFSDHVAQNGHAIKYTDLPGVQPNYPFEEDVFNLDSAPSIDGLPTEVSLVLSFQGVRVAGFPQARRRGRLYLGPWRSTMSAGGRPTSTLITGIANAAATFKAAIEAIGTGNHAWSVWSVADQDAIVIDNGWVDNAFDTQRRRGVGVTSRTTWT